MTDFDEDDGHDVESEVHEIRGALFNDTISVLDPAEPVCLPLTATARQAVQEMVARHQACVLVVDGEGRLAGIFTERDVVTRVVAQSLNADTTPLSAVMTANPESCTESHRVAYAVHCMSVAGYRTVPLVDGAGRPVGVATVSDVMRWLANLFPEGVLNLPPGDRVKNPERMDAG